MQSEDKAGVIFVKQRGMSKAIQRGNVRKWARRLQDQEGELEIEVFMLNTVHGEFTSFLIK